MERFYISSGRTSQAYVTPTVWHGLTLDRVPHVRAVLFGVNVG